MIAKKARRSQRLRARISSAESGYARCAVIDCGRLTAAREQRGLNRHYCQRHIEHYRRHGSYSKGSYSAAVLKPHRRAAQAWLQAQRDSQVVRETVARVRALYGRSGRFEEVFRLAGKSPEERAKIVWARLRHFETDPLDVLAVWLSVELAHRADKQPERRPEFRWVQAAKWIHRMAGGSHKRWEQDLGDGRVRVTEMHKHPQSRGRVLRHVGKMLAEAAQPLVDELGAVQRAATV